MRSHLPDLSEPVFRRRLEPWAGLLDAGAASRLHAHYRTLRLWDRRVGLVGRGTAPEVVERHYGESLEGLRLLPPSARHVLDVGSGAGFPGLVLAAARPDLQVSLAEVRERKAAFLRAAVRAMGLGTEVRRESVGADLPPEGAMPVDCLTARAIRFEPAEWLRIAPRVTPDGSILLWAGRESPEIPGFSVTAEAPLRGDVRRILAYRRDDA